MTKHAVWFVLLFVSACASPATTSAPSSQPSAAPPPSAALTVFCVRHAEKVDASRDPQLSPDGMERAVLLATVLGDAAIERVHSSDYVRHAFPVRLHETYTTDDGVRHSRAVTGPDGEPVLSQEALEARDRMLESLASMPPIPTALDQIVQHFGTDEVAEITGRKRRVVTVRDGDGERLAVRPRPASAGLTEAQAFLERRKRVLVFSMAGGIGRSYHADLDCPNTERRVHYLLEPGWRADQAIQGLGRTHRTHQASAPLLRPVTTDVKGERRFIATIARRLDALGAITRGQRTSQTVMAGGGAALFDPKDNLESPYARAALRHLYLAIDRSLVPGWTTQRLTRETGLVLHTPGGGLKEELPPMAQFLNRLLALRIDSQNALFEALETRIDANVDAAIEAGLLEAGVETIVADSLAVTSRKVLFEHPGTRTTTDLVEVARRDVLRPRTAGDALAESASAADATLMVNERSGRAGVVVPAPVRITDDGAVETRVRILRPTGRETRSPAELRDSRWRTAEPARWRAAWDAEVAGLGTHADSRLWLVTGMLLPVWDRLASESMRVRRAITDDGEQLIGRVFTAAEVDTLQEGFGAGTGIRLTAGEVYDALRVKGRKFTLVNRWQLARTRAMGAGRIVLTGPAGAEVEAVKAAGCTAEIAQWRLQITVPSREALARILERWPLRGQTPDAAAPLDRGGHAPALPAAEPHDAAVPALAREHGVGEGALLRMVRITLLRKIFDGEALTDLFAPLDLHWRERRIRERRLMAGLAPLLRRQAGGDDIFGLAPFEEEVGQ